MQNGLMFLILDILLTLIHLAIVLFNLVGWIFKTTRRAHLISILLTAASWLLLGIWFGLGYCPITDWQWQVKEKLGERKIPNNFIEYFAEQVTQQSFNSGLVSTATATGFAAVALLSVYVNFILPKIKHWFNK